MNYTLDSITHVKSILEQNYKGKDVEVTPYLTEDILNLVALPNRSFFGVLTVATNVVKGVLKNSANTEILTISENSQVIEHFSSLACLDATDAPLVTPLGQFRGFEIIIN
tara:strand:+ start:8364 stop:8693 length:330 start_codon:yes stop_codon:yes gene_type:complete